VVSQAGARWLAEDRGLYDSGQDVSASAMLPCQEASRNTQPCPLYPLREIAIIRASLWELYLNLKRRTAQCS
jgi:hypothetical protein